MLKPLDLQNTNAVAQAFDRTVRAAPQRNTPALREIRREFSKQLKPLSAKQMRALAKLLAREYGYRWLVYELLRYHTEAFDSLGEADLEMLMSRVDGWGSADAFATILSGPLWLKKKISDKFIHRWAKSPNRWRRRVALASTVALNRRSRGGGGNGPRTLKLCSLLVKDDDDMVVKAMSWALRELCADDAEGVRAFIQKYDNELAARIKREVNNKLQTGLKNPRK